MDISKKLLAANFVGAWPALCARGRTSVSITKTPSMITWIGRVLGVYYNIAICPYRLTPVNFTIPPSHIQAIRDALESIKRWLLITARPKVEDCRPFDGFHDFTTHSWHVVLMQTNGAIWSVCGLNSQTVEFMSTRSTVIPLPGSLSLYTSLTGLRNVKGTLRASESLVLVPHTTRFSGFQSSHSSVFWSQ